MGTRGLTMVISDNKPKVAQYGQWDHYPSGQGLTLLRYFRQLVKEGRLGELIHKMSLAKFIDDEKQKEINEWLTSIGCPDGYMTMEQSALFKQQYPYLSRDIGGEIVEKIMEPSEHEIWLRDSSNFAADSLWCEYAYVIDLDKNLFEVYEGFQKRPLLRTERFFYLQEKPKRKKKGEPKEEGNEYYPVRMMRSFDLKNLPTDEEFLRLLEPPEEVEEQE